MDEKTCENCELYITSNTQAMSQHMTYCLKNTAEGLPKGVTQWYCKLCVVYFPTKRSQRTHNKEMGHTKSDFIEKKDESIDRKCSFCTKTKETTNSGMKIHEKYCRSNPDKVDAPRRPISDKHKAILSESMKERHRNNIAAKWKNPHIATSYAEKFFAKVIENEFDDKEVQRELPMGGFFLDFAWPHKMKAIEIDGQQHDREYQKKSDLRKDAKAIELGWDVLRIRFTDMFKDTKAYIKIAKDFIDD